MRQALASVRAEGLEPDAVGMDLMRRVDCGEITTEQAIETYASQFDISSFLKIGASMERGAMLP
jgi:hypothetical protein